MRGFYFAFAWYHLFMYGFFNYFNFHNYSITDIDAMNFICAFVLCLVVTYYGWKAKLDSDLDPKLINWGVIIFIFAYIIYESYNYSPSIIAIKLIFTYACCFFLVKLLNKIFN